MGVLNLTPNSFSDGGLFNTRLKAEEHFKSLVAHGANIIDLGAVATGPGSAAISCAEEISRLELIFKDDFLNYFKDKVRLSVDTYHAEVAEYVLKNGATIINDISGFRADPEIAKVVAKRKADVVLMYSRVGENFPHASSEPIEYDSIVTTIIEFFEERVDFALSQGVAKSQIILDPGMGGFLSPNSKYSWDVIKACPAFKNKFKEFKIICGVSRKKFIKDIDADLDFVSKIIELELCRSGVDIIRTHDVAMLKKVLEISNNTSSC